MPTSPVGVVSVGAVSAGAVSPNVTVSGLYLNPLRTWSPLSTSGKVSGTSAGLPASSVTVTVTLAECSSAKLGVPEITPVIVSMISPGGSPVAP